MLDAPLNYLVGAGPRAHPVTALTWGLLGISIGVVLIIGALLVIGIQRRRVRAAYDLRALPLLTGGPGPTWMGIGVGISTLVLFGALVWTMKTLAAVIAPPSAPVATIEVEGRQWWWDVRYLDKSGKPLFRTANELHVPVGAPVRIRLISRDVIHSFWVPQLAGKTDLIPGQVNLSWLEADRSGVFRGQCTEYCGLQHANMGLVVVAEPAEKYQAWLRDQAQPLAAEAAAQSAGQHVFEANCARCHVLRGVKADSDRGPDLTHLMSRTSLAAGTIPNTPGHLAGWIVNAQGTKPGVDMPDIRLSPDDAARLRTFLSSLR